MNNNWKDIWLQHSNIDQKMLMDYLEGRLSDQEKHQVEAALNDSDFLGDAMEGLSQMKDKQKIAAILSELDHHLKQRLGDKQRKKVLRKAGFPAWLVLTTVALIALVVLAYIIFRMYTTR